MKCAILENMALTTKQKQLLAQLWRFEEETQISPSMAEVKKMMRVKSNQSVIDMLKRLERDRWLTRNPDKARSLSLTPKSRGYLTELGVQKILYHYPTIDEQKTRLINSEKADTTQADSRKSLENVSISYGSEKNSPVPQQLTLFNHQPGILNSDTTINEESNRSFNTIALQWFGHILDSTSTSAVSYAGKFIGDVFKSGFLYFIALKKFTGFSFTEAVIVVAFCLVSVRLFNDFWKGNYVPRH